MLTIWDKVSSVSDLPQMRVHWVPIVLPSFSLQRYSQPKPFLLEECQGGGTSDGTCMDAGANLCLAPAPSP